MNILFIDDDEVLRRITSDVLGCLGYKVKAVSSLASATMALQSDKFDLILSDLSISGDKDGFLILDFLDSMDIEVPVIFITGSCGRSMISTHSGNRNVGFLRKPVRMSELKKAIESLRPKPVSEGRIAYEGEVSPSAGSSSVLSDNAGAKHT